MKYMICDFGVEKWGKTGTLLRLIDVLEQHKHKTRKEKLNSEDVYAVCKIENKTIAVVTFGDPSKHFEEYLNVPIKEDADIIVCASRTKGNTADMVYRLASENEYQLVWFSNYHVEEDDGTLKHIIMDGMAECLYLLICKLIIK